MVLKQKFCTCYNYDPLQVVFFFLHFYSSFQTHDLKTDKTSDLALLNPKIQNNLTAFFIEKLNLKSPNHSMEPVPKSLYVTCACIITAFGT